MENGYSWVTVHRARFDEVLAGADTWFEGPAGAAVWRCGPDSPLGENGFRIGRSAVWGGVGFYDSREAAEAALALPEADLPFAGRAAEAWHGLMAVIAHRGEVDWSTPDDPHPVLVPVDTDPGGVMAVITSAGYVSRDESQLPRIRDFLAKVEEVRDFYATLQANVARQLFNLIGTPEGMTFSIWRDDPGMMRAAYKDGTHRAYMERHKAEPMFDRSSFSRFRLLAARGDWDGMDPLAEARGAL